METSHSAACAAEASVQLRQAARSAWQPLPLQPGFGLRQTVPPTKKAMAEEEGSGLQVLLSTLQVGRGREGAGLGGLGLCLAGLCWSHVYSLASGSHGLGLLTRQQNRSQLSP